MLIEDYYKTGPYLRRWTTQRGHPRCVEDAISSEHTDAAAVLARNAEVRTDIAAVEAYEGAIRLIATVEAGAIPLETVPALDIGGEAVGSRLNPDWVAYIAAICIRDAATERTLAFALVRSVDEPTDQESPEYAAYITALTMIEGV